MASTTLCAFPSSPFISRSLLNRRSFSPVNLTTRRRKAAAIKPMGSTTVSPPPRRSGNYKPKIWDYDSIVQTDDKSNKDEESQMKIRHEELKVKVKGLFSRTNSTLPQLVQLVDSLQLLGLSYQFEHEIKETLSFLSINLDGIIELGDLHSTALLFRVLREKGFNIPRDVFNGFIDAEDGSFGKSCLSHGTKGILSLYEASFYAFPGEKLLDQARNFTSRHLEKIITSSSSSLVDLVPNHQIQLIKVRHALKLPINWRMPRSYSRWYMEVVYSEEENMNPSVLELAKLDFNLVQNIHRKELKEAIRWSSYQGLGEKLPFARDRIVESFIWAVGILPHPQYAKFRLSMAQLIHLLSIIDDVFDIYGSMEELRLFNDAMKRWDIKEIDRLPEYMKICFSSYFNTMNDVAYYVLKEKGVDVVQYLNKQSWCLTQAFLQEAKWYREQYIPTLEEYINNAVISIALPLLSHITYTTATQSVKKEELESLTDFPNLISTTSIISRLVDDIGTSSVKSKIVKEYFSYLSKDELSRGDVHKSVQCCIHHDKVSEEEAREKVKSFVSETWKKVNEERCNRCSTIPKVVVDAHVNFVRIFNSFYLDGIDCFGSPNEQTEELTRSLLFDKIKM